MYFVQNLKFYLNRPRDEVIVEARVVSKVLEIRQKGLQLDVCDESPSDNLLRLYSRRNKTHIFNIDFLPSWSQWKFV